MVDMLNYRSLILRELYVEIIPVLYCLYKYAHMQRKNKFMNWSG
jgi:hypothetical protein